jgi:hypothetical protein
MRITQDMVRLVARDAVTNRFVDMLNPKFDSKREFQFSKFNVEGWVRACVGIAFPKEVSEKMIMVAVKDAQGLWGAMVSQSGVMDWLCKKVK